MCYFYKVKSLFNYNNTIKENSSITIVSNEEYFTDNAHVMEFFDREGIELELKDIESILTQIDKEKMDIDKTYEEIYNNNNLN